MTKRSGFAPLRYLLHPDEKKSLAELEKMKLKGVALTSEDWDLNEAIIRARHMTTFHYDFDRTQATLTRWLHDRGSKEKGYIVVEENGGRPTYYSVADMVRTESAFGIRNINYKTNMAELFSLIGHLTTFTDGVFVAYVKYNKLEQFIREETLS